jgi:serine/threonine protein kinase
MGAQGSVYLCQHVLNGNALSYHAVKKIAVGNSRSYLVDMLKEVKLLELLRHKNIIPYEHVWIEPARFSRYVRRWLASVTGC